MLRLPGNSFASPRSPFTPPSTSADSSAIDECAIEDSDDSDSNDATMGMLDPQKKHHNAHLLPDGSPKKIAMLTSGGDAPGMNSAIRAVVRCAIHEGFHAYVVLEGYSGLVKGEKYIKRQEWDDVRGYQSIGGTEIGTARCMEFKERAGRLQAAKNMVIHGIDALIICGGDGSLTGADVFRREWPGLLDELIKNKEITAKQAKPLEHLTIVGMVGSIDNDLSGTDATIGAYTALGNICEMVDKIGATAKSHSRAFVVEVMGRHCGWLALCAGVALGADFILIPEKPRADNWAEEMEAIVLKHRQSGKRKTIVIIAEGANDVQGKPITANMVKDLLSKGEEGTAHCLRLDTRVTTLGHVQRGGSPCAYDRTLATLQGIEAVRAVMDSTPETPTCVIAINENKICRKPLMQAVRDTQEVAKAIEARDFDKAMSLRDTEFADMYSAYLTTTSSTISDKSHLPENKQMRIGIIHVGAPAGGMNAATRAAVAYCQSRGHKPVAIYNGFAGFTRHPDDKPFGAVRDFSWIEVDDWASKGGSEIGTNRELPSESGFFNVAEQITSHKIDALFLVGGFEAFHALSQLRKERVNYPPFNIPMTLLPATISNNVPGTEYSLGSDTCLNELVDYCDKLKLSASSSRRRVFIVETQGGRCGYIPVMAGLNVGAVAVYTPEESISLDMLAADIKHLRKAFAADSGQARAGRLILVGEKASKVYSANMISNIIKEEAHGRFESRDSLPGHVQQGNIPSPMDRVRAVRLAIKCIEQLEKYAGKNQTQIRDDPMSISVIGFRGAKVVHSAMVDVESMETDWVNRRPKDAFWSDIEPVVDMLSGRPQVPRPERDLDGRIAKDIKRGIMRGPI